MGLSVALKSRILEFVRNLFPDYFAEKFLQKSRKGTTYIYGGYETLSHIKENCEFFLSQEQLDDSEYMHKIYLDIIKCHFRYGTNANEYFCYKFQTLEAKERKMYLPRMKKDMLLIKYMGDGWKEHFNQLKDKYRFYLLSQKFFGRDVCQVVKESDYTGFEKIVSKHGRVFVKPSLGGCGVGAQIIDLVEYGNDPKNAFGYLLSLGTPVIVEEIIKQDERISVWNSSSINTLRIPSFRTKDGIRILYPSIRIGRAGSIIDNAGGGGIFAAVGPEDGKIITVGFDKRGNMFDVHPDSGKQLMGAMVPQWDELVKTVTDLHHLLPEKHKYVAFDMALSTSGWVLVEANWGELTMPQIEFSKGLYKEFYNCLYDNR